MVSDRQLTGMSRDTGGTSRRRFLTASGTLLGGLAAGTSVAAAESEDRFIVDVAGVDWDALTSEVEVLHDLREIDAAVVRGHSADLERVTTEFAPDTSYELDLPHEADVPAEPTDESATDEPLYPFQWDKQAQGVPSAHEVTRGDGTRVAVIDTGVDPAHPDLADAVNEDLSRNFAGDDGDFRDIGYHGTHVSGIVAASDENETGIVGTAPGTDLVALRVFGGPTAGFGSILAAITYSVSVGCDVANLSLGSYPVAREELGEFYGKFLNRTTTYANSEGTLLVAAAGNDAADLQHDKNLISLPNEAAQVMSVSATSTVGFDPTTGERDEPAWTPATYTNYGTNAIDMSAPGGDIPPGGDVPDLVLSTIPTYFPFPDTYAYLGGTSMAAPQVAGAAALVKSANPGYNANQIQSALERAAVDRGRNGRDPYHGRGFLDTAGAVTGDTPGKGNGNGRGNGKGH